MRALKTLRLERRFYRSKAAVRHAVWWEEASSLLLVVAPRTSATPTSSAFRSALAWRRPRTLWTLNDPSTPSHGSGDTGDHSPRPRRTAPAASRNTTSTGQQTQTRILLRVYDRRTDRRRLPECIRATNPVIVEGMRLQAAACIRQHGGRSLFRSADRRSSLTRPRLSYARRCASRRQSANATRMASSGSIATARSPSAHSHRRLGSGHAPRWRAPHLLRRRGRVCIGSGWTRPPERAIPAWRGFRRMRFAWTCLAR